MKQYIQKYLPNSIFIFFYLALALFPLLFVLNFGWVLTPLLFVMILLFPFYSMLRIPLIIFSKKKENKNPVLLIIDILAILIHGSFLLLLIEDIDKSILPYSITTIWFWFIVCSLAYFISTYKLNPLFPIFKMVINLILLIGFFINVLICINNFGLSLLSSFWFALFYLIAFIKNQESIIEKFKNKYL